MKTTQHIHAGWMWTVGCRSLTLTAASERMHLSSGGDWCSQTSSSWVGMPPGWVVVKLWALEKDVPLFLLIAHWQPFLSEVEGKPVSTEQVTRVVTWGSGSQIFPGSLGGSSTELQLQETTLNKRNSVCSSFLGGLTCPEGLCGPLG